MSTHSECGKEGEEKTIRQRATPRQPFDPGRRTTILQAAVRVFARKGFHRTTTKDIAREAGLAEGTLYNHFQNKDALLLALLDGLNETGRREADFAAADQEELETFLPRYFQQRLDALEQGAGDALSVILAELLTNAELRDTYAHSLVAPTLEIAERAFSRWAGQGRLRPEQLELTVRAVAALFLGMVVMRLLGDETLRQRWHELPDALTQLVLHGIGKDAV
ncbi:TetR/AcrR family transcriptional regulator [Deinococcus oregonensis]|uniref:TetR/AcrR family transcriptional regulator n=1 Tax=Deinococcus oregonensis TaxID=1805970 RepID=A0ABV6AV67_9DEIO